MSRVIVIGGGISGLTIAYRLQHDHGIEVLLLESEDKIGGKAQTHIIEGFTCEEATNSWIDKEPAVRDLLADLGIHDRIKPADAAAERRFIFRNGSLHEMHMHPLKFLTSSVLPLNSRLRVIMEPFIKQGPAEVDETLADFARRRLGKGARDLLIGPMASGVFAGDPSQMSLKSCFRRVYDLEQNHGGLVKGMLALKKEKRKAGEDPGAVQAGPSGRLTSLEGGVGDLTMALVAQLEGVIRYEARVVGIQKRGRGFELQVDGGNSLTADVVVSAAPAWAAASFLSSLDDDGARAFGSVQYPSMDVVCLGFRREQVPHPLDGFGYLVPRHQGKVILGSMWSSSIFPGRAPNGCVLIRTMMGGMLEPQVGGWTREQVLTTARMELEDILGIPQSESPIVQRVFRHQQAIPQYHVGHEQLVSRIRDMQNRIPGFFAGGNAIGGVGVLDCVRNGAPLANRVSEYLQGL